MDICMTDRVLPPTHKARSEKREERCKKREARSQMREARSEKPDARSEKRTINGITFFTVLQQYIQTD